MKIVSAELDKKANKLVDRYDDTLIFMDFTFMNTEDNNNETDINLLSTLFRGTDALNIKANNNRRRSSSRNFRTQDSFKGITTANLTCEGRSRNPDYIYPVTGEIGLDEIVDTFLKLNEGHSLISGDVPKERLFSDTLAFSTTVSGTLGPKITLNPVGKALSLANASFTSTNSRIDLHTVIVGLSFPQKEVVVAKTATKSGPSSVRTKVSIPKQSTETQAYELNDFLDRQLNRNLILQLPTSIRPLSVPFF